MAVLQAVKSAFTGNGTPEPPDPAKIDVPGSVKQRVQRAQRRITQGAAMRNLCLRFYRDETYSYVDERGRLQTQPTVTFVNGGGKPRHRIRTKRNMIVPLVDAKVSASTQAIPSFEVNPSSFDPQRVAAASLAKKVAVYGYDQWKMRRAAKKVVTLALVADEGFAWPFFDTSIGPFVPTGQQNPDGSPQHIGVGDVRIRVMSRNEVGWEPGVDFDDSPFYIVQQARTLDETESQDGFLGGKLVADAAASDVPTSRRKSEAEKLVMVTDYLERPCPQHPAGRWITIANGRVIAGAAPGDEGVMWRPYPLTDDQGRPVDEPVLHRLSYRVDPDSDQDLGLVRYLVDAQRSFQDIVNKSLEWKNRVLNPQMLAPVGSIKKRPDDTPGAIIYYNPVGGKAPEWETPIPVPDSLFRMLEATLQDMQTLAASQSVPGQIDSGKGVEAFIEQQQVQWQQFIADLAEWWSRLMRHSLWLVQKHYTEPRLLQIRGRVGWEPVSDFIGAQLLGQADVRVFPGSLQPLTRGAVQDRLMFLVQAFPGQLTLEQAQAALDQGTAENLIDSYELAIERAWRVIQKIKAGPEVLFNTPPRSDGGQMVPGWMPRPFDNIAVQKRVFEDWLQTDDYESLDPAIQEAANLYYQALIQLEQQRAAQAAQQQQVMAESLGAANAAKPQLPPPIPSQALPPGGKGVSAPGGTPAAKAH